jgi:hypothetical protein
MNNSLSDKGHEREVMATDNQADPPDPTNQADPPDPTNQADAQAQEASHKEDVQQELQKLLLQQARQALVDGDIARFDSLAEKLQGTQPSARDDRMDRWRIGATGIILAGLLVIILFIVIRNEKSSNLYQFVSLTSGLAGIGLGWLFGAGTARGR